MTRVFSYEAASRDGSLTRGHISSDSPRAALEALAARGLAALSLEECPPRRIARAPRRAVADALTNLATLLDAGLPVDRALQTTIPTCRGALKRTFEEALVGLRAGEPLSASLRRLGQVIPSHSLDMIAASERAGRLATGVRSASEELAAEAALLGSLRNALAYPSMLLVLGLGLIGLIVFGVLPRFAALFTDMDQSLPPTTAFMLAGGMWLRVHVPVLALAVLLVLVVVAAFARRPSTWVALHHLFLRLPLIGPIRISLASSRTLQMVVCGLSAGMPMLAALEMAETAMPDLAIRGRLARARQRILQGSSPTAALGAEQALSAAAVGLVAMGEASSDLPGMAERAASYSRREAEARLRAMTATLEPLLILVFGAVTAFVALGLLQAVYGLRAS